MKPYKLLIVEDELVIALDLQARLRDLGYVVIGNASSGAAAIAAAEQHKPDLILMDIQLAGSMDGIVTATEIHKGRDVPILFLTAYSDEATLERSQEAMPYGFLLKPVDDRDLRVTIETALGRHEAEKRIHESELRLRRSIKAGKVGLWELDLTSGNAYFSPEWKLQIGCADSEIGNSEEEWKRRIHPDDLDTVLRRIQESMEAPWPEFEAEYRLQHKNGDYRWIMAQASLERDKQGKPVRLLGANIDMTAQKAHAAEIERLSRLYMALSQVNQLITRATTRESMLDGVCRELVRFGHLKMAWIGMLDAKTLQVKPAAQHGDTGGYLGLIEVTADLAPHGRGPTGVAIREGHSVVCNQFETAEATDPWHDAARKQGFRSSAAFPIRNGGVVCGALSVYAGEPGFFKDKEIMLFEEAAMDVSFALDHLQQEQRRRQAEEALTQSERRFRIVSQLSSDFAYSCTYASEGDFCIDWITDGFYALTGFSHEELMESQCWLKYAHPEDKAYATEPLQRMKPGVVDSREFRIVAKNGRVLTVVNHMECEEDEIPGGHRIFGAVRDITARVQAERNYQILFREMLNGFALHEIICLPDGTPSDYRFLAVNPAFERVLGLKADQVVGQTVREIMPDVEKYWIDTYGKVALTGEPIFFESYSAGLQKHFEVAAFRPGPKQFACIVSDITQRKFLEEQLRQTQKLESIGQLAGGVAHDFNNILSAIMIQLSFLQNNKNLDEETLESLGELMTEAKRAATLTRQLLMFSRRSVLDVKVIDLNELVANLLKMLGRLIGEHIGLRFDRHSNLPPVTADPGMIEQVIMNLAVNARDAMPRGGRLAIGIEPVRIDAERIKGNVEVKPGQFVCLSVSDTGTGMDETTRKRIFEPFFTTKEQGKGTGLGLATAHGIIAQHKGWIEVESVLDRGSVFKVFLPATGAAAGSARDEQVEIIKGSETILFVEDEASVRRMVGQGLRMLGYRVLEAGNGIEAKTVWQENRDIIDLLFTDMVMPEGMSGLELAEQLRIIKPDLKVILSSGYNSEMVENEKRLPPGVYYLAKPYEIDVLSRKLRECLDGLKT